MTGDHVVIVGGTRGLGRVTAEVFQARGADVTVLSRSAPTEWNGAAPDHAVIDLETLTEEAAQAVVADVIRKGPVRYLVFSQRYRGTGDIWTGEMQVSLRATDLLVQAFSDHFVDSGDRAIAVVSSVYAEAVGGSQPASYHVAKAGLNALVRHGAWTMGRRGVRMNAIMPLTYLKPESRAYYQGRDDLMDMYARLVPLGRMGEAFECANTVEFLCSSKSSFINGQCLFVDGGVSVLWPEEYARSLVDSGR